MNTQTWQKILEVISLVPNTKTQYIPCPVIQRLGHTETFLQALSKSSVFTWKTVNWEAKTSNQEKTKEQTKQFYQFNFPDDCCIYPPPCMCLGDTSLWFSRRKPRTTVWLLNPVAQDKGGMLCLAVCRVNQPEFKVKAHRSQQSLSIVLYHPFSTQVTDQ